MNIASTDVSSSVSTPFHAHIPDADVQDLRDRLARTRWPEAATVADWSQGVPVDYLQDVCSYWARDYDWRRFEAKLNSFDQAVTHIDGLDFHFVHAPSPEPAARPLLIVHGWPGSVVEHLDVIDALRNPTAYGGQAEDAYHVVVPSLPGFGFSGKPTSSGWSVSRIGAAWVELMRRLGYERFFVQGGDWGAIIAANMGSTQTDAVAGIHVNMALCSPEELYNLGEPTPEEVAQLQKFQYYQDWDSGYSHQQSTRPQTVGYGLTDSPAGQCAWILDKFASWVDCDGPPDDVISRDTLLDNVSLYWFTGTAASSARIYWESYKAILTDFTPVVVPAAYSCFPGDIFTMTERWARTRYHDLRYYSQPSSGGHFPSLERPAAFVSELRSGLRALR
ncbi:epoxide hydrolase family protein [Mycobacterium sp. TY815]|uniref:epoxide hydrolase family protein n=1 Tax=Mycobacterium sp. TY815 TaxID=3050581 RepID=UPI002741E1AD|nr:epoxide hydrolase family protein [Mycobacterium sp. TY815]MDP7704824.1 alpha/beta fold hydrolase [Mycobacterium sp. TY815]